MGETGGGGGSSMGGSDDERVFSFLPQGGGSLTESGLIWTFVHTGDAARAHMYYSSK